MISMYFRPASGEKFENSTGGAIKKT